MQIFLRAIHTLSSGHRWTHSPPLQSFHGTPGAVISTLCIMEMSLNDQEPGLTGPCQEWPPNIHHDSILDPSLGEVQYSYMCL